jgi:hypothetical protein
MSAFKSCLIAASLCSAALAGAAAARPQLTDAQYLSAARCQALMSSPALGKVDTTTIDRVLKTQAAYRMPAVEDRADEVRQDARRAASHAGPSEKAALIAERDGACAATTHDVTVAAMAGSGPSGH